MIRRVEFHNFKALRDVDVSFERLTVFVGPNGSGKTSILQGIDELALALETPDQYYFKTGINPSLVLTRGARDELLFRLWTEDWGQEVLSRPDSTPHGQGPSGWTFIIRFAHTKPSTTTNGVVEWNDPDQYRPDPATLFSVSLLRFDSRRLAAPWFSEDAEPRVRQNGEGLASALAYMALRRPDLFRELKNLLQFVIPIVQDVRFDRVSIDRRETEWITVSRDRSKSNGGEQVPHQTVRQYWGESLILDMEGAPGIPGQHVSDGTLIILGLLTVILQTDKPYVILLDDLDQGLHPKAQRDLVKLLRKLLEIKPDLQIVATSHSPFILDELDPSEIRLTTRRQDGSVACARLDQHPDFEQWKDAMAPGEFWSMVGEQWVADRAAR
jgi:energy-coupling factor transporter ATP-binding protein EcfA2